MIPTLDRVRLDSTAELSLSTGYAIGWAPGTATYLTKLEGWHSSAPVRRSKSDRMNGHGSHAERGWRDERLVSVSGHHVAASRAAAAAYADQLAGYLGDGAPGVFRVADPDLGERWAIVYLATGGVDVAWSGGVDVGFTIHLLTPDPRKFGAPLLSPITGVPVPGQGLRFPLFGSTAPGVLDLGRGGIPGRTSLTNPGTAAAGAVFTVSGDLVPGFTITEVGTGRRLAYVDTVTSGQTVTLDSNNGRVLLDGYAPRNSKLVVAEWSMVPPGATPTWLFESPGSVNAQMTVGVTPAWW